MPFDEQQFRQKAIQAGIPENEINTYLQSKGIGVQQSKPMFGNRGTTGGLLGYVAPVLATLPQVAGQLYGQAQNTKTVQGLSSTLQGQSDIAVSLLKQIQQEKNPTKKAKLQQDLRNIQANSQQQAGLMNELSTGEGVTKSTEIKIRSPLQDVPIIKHIPILNQPILEAPALRPGAEGLQQVAGRSIRQVGTALSPQLGATGSGALYGFGSGIERGSSPLGIAAEAGATAIAFKTFGWGTDKLAGTQMGQRVISSPFGSTALKIGDKIFSPFLAKPASYAGGVTIFPKAYEQMAENQIKNFGKIADKAFSPTMYRDVVKKGLTAVGEKTGVVGTQEERLVNAQQKVTKYWDGAKSRYQTSMKYDDKSPEILGREGIIPRQMGGSMSTAEQAQVVRAKASSEHSLLNRILEESRVYGNVDEIRQGAIQQITKNFQGTERELALKEFNKQFDSLLLQNQDAIVGDGRIPIKLVNDFKSYMWSQGYANKLASKSDQVVASTMRTGGNALKNYVNSTFEANDPAMAEAVIKLNEHSGELFQAAKFLDFMNGKKLPGGFAGRYFARVIGAVVGSSQGPLGAITGSITAEQLAIMMQNPEFSVGKSAILIKQLQQTNPQVVEDAMRILHQLEQTRNSTLLLPSQAGPGSVPIPVAPKGSQMEFIRGPGIGASSPQINSTYTPKY